MGARTGARWALLSSSSPSTKAQRQLLRASRAVSSTNAHSAFASTTSRVKPLVYAAVLPHTLETKKGERTAYAGVLARVNEATVGEHRARRRAGYTQSLSSYVKS